MTIYAYLRVSTDAQDVKNQKHGVKAYADSRGLSPLAYIEDTASGTLDWRKREIGKVIASAQKGEIIIASEVSRLARNTLQALEIMQEAAKKGISMHIAKNQLIMDGSIGSKITVTVLGLAAEIERDFISSRTKEALARRKAEGKPLGRPKGRGNKKLKLDAHRKDILRYLELELSKRAIAKLTGVSPATVTDYLRRNGMEKNLIEKQSKFNLLFHKRRLLRLKTQP